MPITIVDESMRDHAGCVTWWSLTGLVLYEDMLETMEHEGLDKSDGPGPPTQIQALGRAASAALSYTQSSRQLLRPLRARGKWEIVEETFQRGEDAREVLKHTALMQLGIENNEAVFALRDVPGVELLQQKILEGYAFQQTVLDVTDMSGWLTTYAIRKLSAVSLRDRGGFYFIPQEHLATWRAVNRVVGAVGGHRIHEIPAVHTEQLVESVLHALRTEADVKLKEMENYLQGATSTRGLNAIERDTAEVRAKLSKYARLLGAGLDDVVDRLDQLSGQVIASRILHEKEKQAEGG